MIKLEKIEEPEVLKLNGAAWLQDLLKNSSPSDSQKGRYRHKEIKKALEQETHGKCAYCESKLKHIHHGDVEHIYPKSLDKSKQFQWENLTLACEICNQKKSNLDPHVEHIIDPYKIDPSDHIDFVGNWAMNLGTTYGLSTISILGLNRAELIEMRSDVLTRIIPIFEMLLREDIPINARKVILENLENNEASRSGQYSSMVKKALEDFKKKHASNRLFETQH